MYWHYKKQIRNIFWAFIILTHPSVLQELDFIIYTWGGGSWYFRPRPRGGLTNFTPIAGMGHLISEPKFKIPTPPSPPLLISGKSLIHTVYCFQPRATLRNWVSRHSVFFECDQSVRWLPIVEHIARAFLTYSFKKRFAKNISRTGLNFNRATV